MRAISRAYLRKNISKFDKLRDLVYVHSKPTFTGVFIFSTDPLYVAPTRKQLWWPIRHAARILATDSRWTRRTDRTTSVVPPGGSSRILQNDRL